LIFFNFSLDKNRLSGLIGGEKWQIVGKETQVAFFQGTYQYSLDEKGRVSIPAKFRKPDESTTYDIFVITRGLDGCLFVYPVSEWEKVREKMRGQPYTQRKTRLYERYVFPNTIETELDKQGRIAIPQHLLDYAKIKKEVKILGVLERIEIWDPEVYNEYLAKAEMSYEDVAEELFPWEENPKKE
jgi:MraZ protein